MNSEKETDDGLHLMIMQLLLDIIQSRSKKVLEEEIENTNDFQAGRDIMCLALQSISALNNGDEPQCLGLSR